MDDKLSIRQTAMGLLNLMAQLTDQQTAMVNCLQSKNLISADDLAVFVRAAEEMNAPQWQAFRALIDQFPD